MHAFESVGYTQQEMFIGCRADELEPYGQTGGGEAAGNGDGRNAGEIGGAIVAEQKGAGRVILFVDARGFLIYEWRDDRGGGDDESVNRGVGHRQMEPLDKFFA